jgi:hypothetical protein
VEGISQLGPLDQPRCDRFRTDLSNAPSCVLPFESTRSMTRDSSELTFTIPNFRLTTQDRNVTSFQWNASGFMYKVIQM